MSQCHLKTGQHNNISLRILLCTQDYIYKMTGICLDIRTSVIIRGNFSPELWNFFKRLRKFSIDQTNPRCLSQMMNCVSPKMASTIFNGVYKVCSQSFIFPPGKEAYIQDMNCFSSFLSQVSLLEAGRNARMFWQQSWHKKRLVLDNMKQNP